jgi:hypothetical protein
MADKIKQWRDLIYDDPLDYQMAKIGSLPEQLYPSDKTTMSLGERRRRAQELRESGVHVPVPTSKEATIDLGKNLPKFPVRMGALAGMTQKEADEASQSAAGIAQAVWDYGSLPFYVTPAAPIAAAFDVSRGIVTEDPIEVGLATLGIARPLKSLSQTMPEASERALTYSVGAASGGMTLQDFFFNLGEKASDNN